VSTLVGVAGSSDDIFVAFGWNHGVIHQGIVFFYSRSFVFLSVYLQLFFW
jgi:hypothetical protein